MNQSVPAIDEIADAVRGRQAWGIRTFQTIIGIDSIAPNEAVCQTVLADLLRDEGLAVDLVPLDNGWLRQTEGFIDSGLPLDNRPNLLVTAGGKQAGARSLILNSHIDTVAWEATADQWDVHPLSGEVRGGRLYGRGSMDAKGQVMAALIAVLALRDLGYEPPGRVTVQSVVSEEPDGNGTLAACAVSPKADAAINLEATENHVAYGHRGILGLRFVFHGQARHGSVGGRLRNPIVAAGQLADVLQGSFDQWTHPSDKDYGPPTMNVARISGGDDIFTTPYICTLECGVRYAPGTEAAIYDHLNQVLQEADGLDLDGVVPVETALDSYFDAAGIAPESDLTQAFLEAAREVDETRQLTVFPACCDARHFINRYQIPTLIFGPGKLSLAHSENEYLDLAQWEQASRILAGFITRSCV